MKLIKWVSLLQTHLQDEQCIQKRLQDLLVSQEEAVLAGDTNRLEETGRALARELAGESLREQRRRGLMAQFAGELGVPAQALTVGSLMERLEMHGIATAGLRRVRDELRESVVSARKQARKLKTLARGHGEVLQDVLRLIAGTGERNPESGILIDAEV